jgi:hypothetical protein
MRNILLYSIVVFSLLMLSSCQNQEAPTDEPFIFHYKYDTIASENVDEVNRWLSESKLGNSKVSVLENKEGYYYFYGKGYSDVLVSYRMNLRNNIPYTSLIASFKKGNPEDEVFIQVTYNPVFCCNDVAVDENYEGE